MSHQCGVLLWVLKVETLHLRRTIDRATTINLVKFSLKRRLFPRSSLSSSPFAVSNSFIALIKAL